MSDQKKKKISPRHYACKHQRRFLHRSDLKSELSLGGEKKERKKSSAESNLLRNEAVKHDGRPLAVFSAQASKPALLFNNASVPVLLVPGRDGGRAVCVRV